MEHLVAGNSKNYNKKYIHEMVKKYHVLSNASTHFDWTHYFYIFEK